MLDAFRGGTRSRRRRANSTGEKPARVPSTTPTSKSSYSHWSDDDDDDSDDGDYRRDVVAEAPPMPSLPQAYPQPPASAYNAPSAAAPSLPPFSFSSFSTSSFSSYASSQPRINNAAFRAGLPTPLHPVDSSFIAFLAADPAARFGIVLSRVVHLKASATLTRAATRRINAQANGSAAAVGWTPHILLLTQDSTLRLFALHRYPRDDMSPNMDDDASINTALLSPMTDVVAISDSTSVRIGLDTVQDTATGPSVLIVSSSQSRAAPWTLKAPPPTRFSRALVRFVAPSSQLADPYVYSLDAWLDLIRPLTGLGKSRARVHEVNAWTSRRAEETVQVERDGGFWSRRTQVVDPSPILPPFPPASGRGLTKSRSLDRDVERRTPAAAPERVQAAPPLPMQMAATGTAESTDRARRQRTFAPIKTTPPGPQQQQTGGGGGGLFTFGPVSADRNDIQFTFGRALVAAEREYRSGGSGAGMTRSADAVAAMQPLPPMPPKPINSAPPMAEPKFTFGLVRPPPPMQMQPPPPQQQQQQPHGMVGPGARYPAAAPPQFRAAFNSFDGVPPSARNELDAYRDAYHEYRSTPAWNAAANNSHINTNSSAPPPAFPQPTPPPRRRPSRDPRRRLFQRLSAPASPETHRAALRPVVPPRRRRPLLRRRPATPAVLPAPLPQMARARTRSFDDDVQRAAAAPRQPPLPPWSSAASAATPSPAPSPAPSPSTRAPPTSTTPDPDASPRRPRFPWSRSRSRSRSRDRDGDDGSGSGGSPDVVVLPAPVPRIDWAGADRGVPPGSFAVGVAAAGLGSPAPVSGRKKDDDEYDDDDVWG
ncbi:hypothetical protein DFJ73DRAFT_929960 [Zopfochytrium polystomum]|nr:hypothetical protein DFJ73DRAFT_929960 [Zopfochytrium polystomum]